MVIGTRRALLGSSLRSYLLGASYGSVLYYLGLDFSGSALPDFSGQGNHGTIVGATWVRLQSGLWVLNYDGTDDVVTKTSPSFATDQAGTVEAWIYTTAASGTVLCFSKYSTGHVDELQFYVESSYRLDARVQINSGAVYEIYTGANALTTSTWHHIAVTSDGSTSKLYLAGVLQTVSTAGTNSGEWFGDLTTDADQITVGAIARGSSLIGDFTGRIALLRVYSTALSAATLLARYNLERAIFGV